MLRGIPCLIAFYLLGEGIVWLTSFPVPGAVVGMLLLFFALRIHARTTLTNPNTNKTLNKKSPDSDK